ncbi:hypothetical protein [Pseudomonas fluorescens]|uniref:hypothetical protein n=1 Tax=Pseudomonas fluorescens TaxID=294 RepID=UPI0007D05533|nr:hypothetical protein [Pseudomonas fluorescens]
MTGPQFLSAVDTLDQAAGLRRWARQNQAAPTATVREVERLSPTPPDRTLMLFGSAQMAGQVYQTLERWHHQGHPWVGHPNRWHVLPVCNSRQDLQALAQRQPCWGLWVDSDLDAFRRTFQTLRQLGEQGGPNQVLALHPGFSRQGLLGNLQDAARRYLGIRLLLVDEAGH